MGRLGNIKEDDGNHHHPPVDDWICPVVKQGSQGFLVIQDSTAEQTCETNSPADDDDLYPRKTNGLHTKKK